MHTKQALSGKTEAALAELAMDLGLELDTAKMAKKDVIEAILKAEADDAYSAGVTVETTEDDEVIAKETKRRNSKYKVILHNQEGVNNTPFVKVGVNGILTAIPREVEVVISHEIKHVLDSAVESHYDQTTVNGVKVVAERLVRRFPYTLVEVM